MKNGTAHLNVAWNVVLSVTYFVFNVLRWAVALGDAESPAVLLKSLLQAHGAGLDPGREDLPSLCLEGTCVDIVSLIMLWLQCTHPNSQPIFWLEGVAGIGKSSIAKTIAEKARSERMLGACFSVFSNR